MNVKSANDSVLKIASTVHDVLFTMISDILKSYLRLSILLIVLLQNCPEFMIYNSKIYNLSIQIHHESVEKINDNIFLHHQITLK